MSEGALFIGWGPLVTGRELAAIDLFQETKDFFEGLLKNREITAYEPILLAQVGGPFKGFFVVRGDAMKLNALTMQPDFRRLTTKATLVLENVAVLPAFIGAEVPKIIDTYRTEINTLALQHQHA